MLGSANDFSRRLLRWYVRDRRDLPWRAPPGQRDMPDPYLVLVSEAMLQQTQVATVIPYFHRFIDRLPTFAALAEAQEQEVLRLWQGLGYYSRARNLLAAARMVMGQLRGKLPKDVNGLLRLPGVGRYTAGAVASIAFGRRAPILDGNVTRVLCRLDRIADDPREKSTQGLLWRRAEDILPRRRVGEFNSALMELGATICTPRAPRCGACPVQRHCEARAGGIEQQIPAPRKTKPTPLLRRQVYCIRRDDRWLIEQRPSTGRWGGLWQFITIDADCPGQLATLPVRITQIRRLGEVTHALTHRRYQFEVFACKGHLKAKTSAPRPRLWVPWDELDHYPLPRPHLKIADMLRRQDGDMMKP